MPPCAQRFAIQFGGKVAARSAEKIISPTCSFRSATLSAVTEPATGSAFQQNIANELQMPSPSPAAIAIGNSNLFMRPVLPALDSLICVNTTSQFMRPAATLIEAPINLVALRAKSPINHWRNGGEPDDKHDEKCSQCAESAQRHKQQSPRNREIRHDGATYSARVCFQPWQIDG